MGSSLSKDDLAIYFFSAGAGSVVTGAGAAAGASVCTGSVVLSRMD